MAFAGGYLRLETIEPHAGDHIKSERLRQRSCPASKSRDQRGSQLASSGEVTFYGAEVQLTGVPGADRVLAVGLYVNAPLYADASCVRGRLHRSLPPSRFRRSRSSRRTYPLTQSSSYGLHDLQTWAVVVAPTSDLAGMMSSRFSIGCHVDGFSACRHAVSSPCRHTSAAPYPSETGILVMLVNQQ